MYRLNLLGFLYSDQVLLRLSGRREVSSPGERLDYID